MPYFRFIIIGLASIVGSSCSQVKIALYDNQKRQEYTKDTKEAFSKSEAGLEFALKNAIIDTASLYLGTRYKYGSIDPKQGFDCSGLVYHVAKKNKMEVPRSSSTLAASAPHFSWKKAKPGDLVFFGDKGKINHVGIVEKNKPDELWIIHSTTKRGVMLENVLASSYWKKRILFAVDFTQMQSNTTNHKS